MATSTTHYGLNIAQGSDIVNPLVDTFPNFTKIDDAMWANKLGGVVVGTHLLSGSVHAITISDAEGFSMFRFVATAQFTEGQTFTVNGTPVTALTTAGTTLGTGCFVVNQIVLCCLVGTQLTLYVENVGGTAADSEKLGGQLPSYYATQTDLTGVQAIANNALSTANSANTTASGASATASAAQQTANALKPVTIWTNSSPDSNFSAQDITVDDYAAYDTFEIYFRAVLSSTNQQSGKYTKDSATNKITPVYLTWDGSRFVGAGRSITFSDGKISVGDANYIGSTANNYLVPLKIVGYKAV